MLSDKKLKNKSFALSNSIVDTIDLTLTRTKYVNRSEFFRDALVYLLKREAQKGKLVKKHDS